ncbi:hypothetical protein Aca07nite_83630 [Actinoplanes capillaceus]|uniref:DUF4328 domain-containing protein n=1 Tax=Actinoplanes campanulatus TaxID=113559 RepID=A0ABQ3WXR2_9ACTN|nr:hypothetical protein [Actinoplanes capillaceus]GID51088.1 hypothetical protein Aca07nite_83630 [Actinoplanes capillaceus]
MTTADDEWAPASPPKNWEWGTRALMLAVAATGGLAVVYLIGDLAVWYHLRSGDEAVSPTLTWIIEHIDSLSLLGLFLLGAYLVGFFVWRRRTKEALRGYVSEPDKLLSHWSVPVWNAAIFASFLIRMNVDTSAEDIDGMVRAVQVEALQNAMRLAGLTVLLIGVWEIRDRVRAGFRDSGVMQRTRRSRGLIPFQGG